MADRAIPETDSADAVDRDHLLVVLDPASDDPIAQKIADVVPDGVASTTELWTGDIAVSTSNQWVAAGTDAVPDSAKWILFNGGKLAAADDDGPNADWKWINATDWRALTAASAGDAVADGTGMLFVDWVTGDIATTSFVRRDVKIGRTATNSILITSMDAGEDFAGAKIRYVSSVSAGAASSFSDLTGTIADSQVPDSFARDAELASLIDDITISGNTLTITLQDGSTETRTLPGGGGASAFADLTGQIADSQVPDSFTRDTELGTAAAEDIGVASGDIPVLGTGGTLVDARIPATVTRDTQLASYAELSGATFTGAARGLDPTSAQDFVTKAFADIHYAGGAAPTDHELWVGWSADATVSEAEVLAGSSSDTNTATIPTATGNQYLFVWRANADGGDPTEVHISGGGNQRNTFGTATALQVDGVDGQLIVSVTTQNAGLLSSESVRVV